MRLSAGLTMTMNDRSGGSIDLVSNASAHATSGKQDDLLVSRQVLPRWGTSACSQPLDIYEALRCDALSFAHPLPGNRVAQHACVLVVSQHTAIRFPDLSPFRRFHSIAAWCGNALRPEPQALFERLALDSAFCTLARSGRHSACCHEQEISVGRPGYCRAFTACLVRTQGLFTAFCTETYPGSSQAFPHNVTTGNPQASPPSHPPVFHNLSTGCRPIRPQANSRPVIRLLELLGHPALSGALDVVGNPTCQIGLRPWSRTGCRLTNSRTDQVLSSGAGKEGGRD
jgi:hypothetical protein